MINELSVTDANFCANTHSIMAKVQATHLYTFLFCYFSPSGWCTILWLNFSPMGKHELRFKDVTKSLGILLSYFVWITNGIGETVLQYKTCIQQWFCHHWAIFLPKNMVAILWGDITKKVLENHGIKEHIPREKEQAS